MNEPITATGWLGSARFDGKTVTVNRAGRSNTAVPIENVQAIDVGWAGGMGVFRVAVAGTSPQGGRGYGRARSDAMTVTFLPWQRGKFTGLRDAVLAVQH